MSAAAFIHTLGSLGIFPSRAFIPAFLTALILRVGPQIPAVQNSGLLSSIGTAPTWFTSDATLIILGILSLIEIIATKNADAREFMNEADKYIKSGMAFLVSYGVLSATDRQTVDAIRTGGALELTDMGLSAGIAGAVYWLASLRSKVLGFFGEADSDDDVGIQKFLMWMEDLWVAFGFFLLLIYPMLVLVAAAGIGATYFALSRYIQYRAEKIKVPCSHCQTAIHPSALYCPHCKAQVAQPKALGFMGSARKELVADRTEHALELISSKRCPCCATRFELRAARQDCASCGHKLMSDKNTQQAYVNRIDQRVGGVLLVSAFAGLVPIIGMIFALIYFRVKLVSPFRQYIGFGTGFFVKWSVRVLNLLLILLQLIPPLGLIVVPLMAYTNYRVYRGVYEHSLATPATVTPTLNMQPAAVR
jgi:hypothetical protein